MISERLKRLRMQRGHSQEGMARIAGMSQSAWAGWEQEPPKALKSLIDLASHYGVSTDYLLALTDDPAPRHTTVDAQLAELLEVLPALSARRQRDLLLMARAYLADREANAGDPHRIMDDMISLIQEYSGTADRDTLIRLLEELPGPPGTMLLGGNGAQ